MPAAKKKPVADSQSVLSLHRTPFSKEGDSYGELVVSIHPVARQQLLDVELRVGIENRDRNIARGEPIEGSLFLPNYEKIDPSTEYQRLPVHLDQLENIAHAILHIAAEAKRLGIIPRAEAKEG
jgi:hypothetical protein